MSGKVPWVKMTATIGGCEFHPVCHTQGLSSETTQIHHLSSSLPPFFFAHAGLGLGVALMRGSLTLLALITSAITCGSVCVEKRRG